MVVPCFNEANRFNADYWKAIIQDTKDVKWVFVNDGSTDNTNEVLLPVSNLENVTIINLEINKGKAEAIRIVMRSILLVILLAILLVIWRGILRYIYIDTAHLKVFWPFPGIFFSAIFIWRADTQHACSMVNCNRAPKCGLAMLLWMHDDFLHRHRIGSAIPNRNCASIHTNIRIMTSADPTRPWPEQTAAGTNRTSPRPTGSRPPESRSGPSRTGWHTRPWG